MQLSFRVYGSDRDSGLRTSGGGRRRAPSRARPGASASTDASRARACRAQRRAPPWPGRARSTRASGRASRLCSCCCWMIALDLLAVQQQLPRAQRVVVRASSPCSYGGMCICSSQSSPSLVPGVRLGDRRPPLPQRLHLRSPSARCPPRSAPGCRSRDARGGCWRRSSRLPPVSGLMAPLHVEEAAHPDRAGDHRDRRWPRSRIHGAIASTSWFWISGKNRISSRSRSMKMHLHQEQREDRRGRADQQASTKPFDQERHADAPVRRAHQSHDADLLAAREHPHAQRVRDQTPRRTRA